MNLLDVICDWAEASQEIKLGVTNSRIDKLEGFLFLIGGPANYLIALIYEDYLVLCGKRGVERQLEVSDPLFFAKLQTHINEFSKSFHAHGL